jgi:hypothetical protein
VFLYAPGAALSVAELSAARIDGHVVEVGDAYIPADAVETAQLRAASLATLVPTDCAVTHVAAAWIHGAVPSPPVRVAVQRTRPGRRRVDQSLRIEYRDSLLAPADLVTVGGLPVTTPTRTLADLARTGDEASRAAVRLLIGTGIADPDAARRWLWTHSGLPHTGSALRLLGRLRTT